MRYTLKIVTLKFPSFYHIILNPTLFSDKCAKLWKQKLSITNDMPFWHEESHRIPIIHSSVLLNVNKVYNCTETNDDDFSSV